MTIHEVTEITGLSTSTIYKYIKLKKFPEPKRIGSRTVRWRLSDIQDFINS
ncbi:helix-turn-helix transcriptional regulator [Ursidibacter maritimus]|uniref:helix-turn-helix transcriptional regulator n=1 Tax=Ursidibacter maritimus TaxID=1331689 RepID=UPI0021D10ACF|nr:AlpA family phage regulatory protein [Ursidibacter maritimus]MBV6534164.1 AlpA family phage regulatory protein [Ursidibacter maritimus]